MSKNLNKVKVKIKGTRPLLWHHFGPETISLDRGTKREGVAGNDPTEWQRTVLQDDGRLYVEPSYIFGCAIAGAKFTKKGRGTLQSTVAATLQVEDGKIFTDRTLPEGIYNGNAQDYYNADKLPTYVDVRGVKNPATKARNVRYRVAASPGWEMEFTLVYDKTIVSKNEIQAIMNDAGALVGLGSGRSIGFGRFEVIDFNETK